MKTYIAPSAEKIEFDFVDIITVSAPDKLAIHDNTALASMDWFG